jgi:TolB-like protein
MSASQPGLPMPDIFLSYTREDQATAQRFAEAFEAQGFSVWWDVTLRSGEAYDQVTEEALRSAKAVVVLWSKKSVVSRWVRAEATLGDRNRTLVPAMIELCDRPIMFELTQTADLSHWAGETGDPAWRTFLDDVRRFIAQDTAPKRAPPPVSAPPVATPRSTRPSIAVLPLINRSGVKADDVFANGMAEDLTAALSGSRRMKVVASSATVALRKGARDIRRIGRDLGVRYLLEGNVRRVGEDLRVTAQLVEAETCDILWTQKFDRPLSELSALQEDLVTEVVAHLGVQVERVEMEHALKKPGNITAWEAVVRADANVLRFTRAGTEAAVAEAERAVEIDPGYGAGYAALAAMQGRLLSYAADEDAELRCAVVDNIRRARALDPSNPLVLCRIAGAYLALGQPREALPLAERGVAMNPNLEVLHMTLGEALLFLGRWDDAIAEMDAAERLAPNGFWSPVCALWRSMAHLRAGRSHEALQALERSVRLTPSNELLMQRVLCLAKLSHSGARDALDRLRDADAAMSWAQIENFIKRFYAGSDAFDDHVAVMRELWDAATSEPGPP